MTTLVKPISKQEKVEAIINILESLYPEVPVPLDHTDPYTLLIAVLLSAQCTDERVNQITPKLFARADNPFDMVQMSIEEIQDIIRPCGLSPMKSKGIWHLSDMIIRQHNGEVPADFAALEAMPAVGHKTASVVMSQGFGIPAFPVDTHIHRLMYRWGLSNGKSVEQTERDAKRLFPREKWNDLHLQIIFYGREYCPARGFDLNKCIITREYGRKSFINEVLKEQEKKAKAALKKKRK
ncbi:MAG: endonuclease III [Pseudomonadota bacterium]|jgi:endonuclease-3|uniref:endonuclease III domain-containing protein n=1 Tax=Alteromonas sp. MTD1 TaxID=3057962 RepID=UPI002EC10C81|nr:endonuclease III [Pseudomonadota bacterium]MEC8419134.1 endonuclease III [Pseudomonadota bacterium]